MIVHVNMQCVVVFTHMNRSNAPQWIWTNDLHRYFIHLWVFSTASIHLSSIDILCVKFALRHGVIPQCSWRPMEWYQLMFSTHGMSFVLEFMSTLKVAECKWWNVFLCQEYSKRKRSAGWESQASQVHKESLRKPEAYVSKHNLFSEANYNFNLKHQ